MGDLSCFHSEHIKNELQKADDPQTRKLLADLLTQEKAVVSARPWKGAGPLCAAREWVGGVGRSQARRPGTGQRQYGGGTVREEESEHTPRPHAAPSLNPLFPPPPPFALLSQREPGNPFHACNSSYIAPKGAGEWHNHFSESTHALPFHHPRWEYFIFLYTWSAHPPYEVTHIR